MDESYEEALIRTAEAFKKLGRKIIAAFQRAWAQYVVKYGSPTIKKRAMIWLHTKNKRIKAKQWEFISPFGGV